jgi:hypothetical protein
MWNLAQPLLHGGITYGSIFEMPIHITLCKCTLVILEQNFHLFCFISYVKEPVGMYMCFQIHFPNFVLTYLIQRTVMQNWVIPQFNQFMLQFLWNITDFNGEWIFKEMSICNMATEVIKSDFKILSKGISHFCSINSWKGNTYQSILMKQITGRKMTKVNIFCFWNSFRFTSKSLTAQGIS